MSRTRSGRTRSARSPAAAQAGSRGSADAEPLDAPEAFLARDDLQGGSWATALQLLDEVEEALTRSSRAMEVHFQVAALEQQHRIKLMNLGSRVVRAVREHRLALPADLAPLIDETEQLRLAEDAARQLALSLTRDVGAAGEEEVTQVFTDRLP